MKLSALHPRYARAKHERVMQEVLPRLKSLLLAKRYDIGLNIDAEEADRLELSLDLFEDLAFDPDLAGWNGIGIVVQAYQKRCPFVLDYLIDLARRSQHRFMVRLVRGLLGQRDQARAGRRPGRVSGLHPQGLQRRLLSCLRQGALGRAGRHLPAVRHPQRLFLAAVYQLGQGKDYEFQCLHGMGETLYDQVVGKDKLDRPCRVYAPVGTHETLLAYLVRRLLENGANSSFVNRLVDPAVSIDELVTDQVAEAAQLGGRPST